MVLIMIFFGLLHDKLLVLFSVYASHSYLLSIYLSIYLPIFLSIDRLTPRNTEYITLVTIFIFSLFSFFLFF